MVVYCERSRSQVMRFSRWCRGRQRSERRSGRCSRGWRAGRLRWPAGNDGESAAARTAGGSCGRWAGFACAAMLRSQCTRHRQDAPRTGQRRQPEWNNRAMGVRVGFTEIQAGLCGSTRIRASHHSRRQIAFLQVNDHIAPAGGPWVLEIYLGTVAHGAMWGYGVDPPSDVNPHRDVGSFRSPSVPALRAGTPDNRSLGRLSASPIRGVNALVTLILGLSPASVPGRPGPCQVHRRSTADPSGPHGSRSQPG
jgi:hypothetical protein